ncbi:MAG: electron transfer flavoprotein subunit alpha/FixB family protein [Chloroflexi bacterium]|nr:electron transfer flavoprotein subunit alpha/FixB family protein [Chloroflexota bacterium]
MQSQTPGEVWILAEQAGGRIEAAAHGLVFKGRKLAHDLGVRLTVLCFGQNVEGAEELLADGADRVCLVDDPDPEHRDGEIYARALVEMVRRHQPAILLTTAGLSTSAFFPRVAAALETGLSANCTALEIDPQTKVLRQTRPALGGNVLATMESPVRRPQMATVRPYAFKRGEPDPARRGEIVRVDLESQPAASRTRLLKVINDLDQKVKLEEADIVVCGGRGLGKAENFQVVAALAEALGAGLACSRPPVDDGWIPYSHQIGQTGRTVAPRLYIACGVSGAPQHLAGMQTSEVILAINSDPQAPIFEVASYGIVGDLFKVVPLLTAKLRGLRG